MSNKHIGLKQSDLKGSSRAISLRSVICFLVVAVYGIGLSDLATAQPILSTYRCTDGEYKGPDTGKSRYLKDDFTWFVTRDFAKRFCMPESFVDEQLKGAEALAWRVKPSEEAICSIKDGKEICSRKNLFELDLYLKSNLALPKADPEVLYYWNDLQPISSSGEIISTNRRLIDMHARREGKYQEPPGGRAPFFTPSGSGEKNRVLFLYLRAMPQGTLRLQTDLIEKYYRANWANGLDIVSLRASTGLGLGTIDDPANPYREIRNFVIGVNPQRKQPGNMQAEDQLTRRDYAHTIEVPDRLGAMISAYDSKRWDELFGPIKRAISGQVTNVPEPGVVLPLRP